MKGALRIVMLVATVMLFTGCGTLVNLACTVVPIGDQDKEWPMLYGGVQLDAALLSSGPLSMPSGGDGKSAAIFLGLFLADFPASFVGDTLTVPLVLGIYRIRKSLREDEDESRSIRMERQPKPEKPTPLPD